MNFDIRNVMSGINILHFTFKNFLNDTESKTRVRILFSETNFHGLFQNFSRTQIDFSRVLKFTFTSMLPRSQC